LPISLTKLRRRDRSAVAAPDVLHVRIAGVDELVVGPRQWHAPQKLTRGRSRLDQLLGQTIVVREEPRVLFPERDQYGAGQRCQIDDEARLEALLRIPEHICEYEPAFSVSIEHLDRLAGHGCDDVAGPLRRP